MRGRPGMAKRPVHQSWVLDEVLAAVTVRSLGKGHWRSAIDFLSEATARHFRVKLNVVSYSTSL